MKSENSEAYDQDLQADAAAACCAEFYSESWVQDILGESFHPGGKSLSSRLIHSLGLPPGTSVLDAACGIGTTTHLMARRFGLNAIGIDLSRENIDRARQNCTVPSAEIDFACGPVDSLPYEDASFDAVICECAVSTFVNQSEVLAEFNRVLKPGGMLGISDMALEGTLPEEIASQMAPWTCLTKARSVQDYQRLFLESGFTAVEYVDESAALNQLVADLKRKLLAAGLGKALGAINGEHLSIGDARRLLKSATQLIDDGTIQYCRMVYSKGRPVFQRPAELLSPDLFAFPDSVDEGSSDCGCSDGNCC